MKTGRSLGRGAAWLACVWLGVAGLGEAAQAQGGGKVGQGKKVRPPADAFKQRIIVSDGAFPSRFEDDEAMTRFVKKAERTELWPEREGGAWRLYYMAFFAEPLEQRNYYVQFVDVTEPDKPLLLSEDSLVATKTGLRIMSGDYELSPSSFQGERRILMMFLLVPGEPAMAEVEFVLRNYDPNHAAELKQKKEEETRAQEEERRQKQQQQGPAWAPPDW